MRATAWTADARVLLRFLRRFRHLWGRGILTAGCGALSSGLQLLVPLSSVVIINRVLPEKDVWLLAAVAAGVGLATLGSMASAYCEFYFGAVFRERMTLQLQRDLLQHVQRLSLGFFRRNESGYVMGRLLTDTEQAVDAAAGTTSFGRILVLLATAALLVPAFHPVIGVVVLAILPLYGLVLVLFNDRIRERFEVVQEETARSSRELHQAIAGIAETKAYGAERHRTRRYLSVAVRRVRSLVKGRALMALGKHSTKGIVLGVSLFILVYGGYEVMQGDLTLGELVALNALTAYLLAPVNETVGYVFRAQKSLAAVARIDAILDEEPEDAGTTGPAPAGPVRGHVRFDSVRFGYAPDQPVLDGVDLEVTPGETVLLLGPSGVGKTTLVSLLPRFHRPWEGTISLDGLSVERLPLGYLRNQIAFVSQDSFLFSESIRDNIRLGRPGASRREVEEAARAANVLEFADRLRDGLDTEVGERGCRLSGGQRQRIAIARALLKGASVLILDEASSAVDAENEIALYEALERLCRNRTTLVIAHHASNFLDRIDRTFSLEQGRLRPVDSVESHRLVRAVGV